MLYLLDLFGVAVFAITGALAAGRKRMDVFGIVVVAIVTALGGGTLRDLILGARPVFWVTQPEQIVVATVAAIGTFIVVRFTSLPGRALLLFDAFGLALFTIGGCQKALPLVDSDIIVVIMGILTGVAGGVIRDILCGEIPVILRREVYATAALLGCIAFVLLRGSGIESGFAAGGAMLLVLAVRLAAIHWRISLPTFNASSATE